MGRVNTPQLSERDRIELASGFKKGDSHCFRNRCHVILLKSEGRSSKDVGLITGMSHISVNHWVNRFKSEGISGLHNKPGQGRKPVLDSEDKGQSEADRQDTLDKPQIVPHKTKVILNLLIY
jgi:transposase